MTRAIVATLLVASSVMAAEEKPHPQASPGTVTMPLREYEQLLDRAAKPPKRPELPPVAAVLARAEIHLRVTGDAARATLNLDGEVYRTGPTKVPLLAGATLLDARLAGRPLPLVPDGAGCAAILPGPGAFAITLDWGAALTAEPGRASFVLPVPSAGSVRATLEVPGEQADVHVEPGLITRRSTVAGKTMVEATLDPGSRARFSWSARDAAATAPREARFLSDVKTLVTVGEADLRLAALVDVSVLQGEPQRFELHLPAGFEVTGATGSSLERTEERPGVLALVVRDASRRRHQFLVSLEHANGGGSFKTEAPLPWVDGAQRETGEAAVEGIGTMELNATEGDGMRRMDIREAAEALKGLARQPLLAAFRYHHKAGDLPRVGLDVKRFPDAAVLAAVAERAVVTTLVTTEGRTLTEVSLTVRNHAQPFLKVVLPEGANLLSADVAGESVKPVTGDDGTRVPLLRTGFRPDGPYTVSFVYLQPGTALGKKGEAKLGLPRLDVPVDLLSWELFLPDRYRVSDFGGNALPASLVPNFDAEVSEGVWGGGPGGVAGGVLGGRMNAGPGQIAGRITDQSGAAIPGVSVVIRAGGRTLTATTDGSGEYLVSGFAPGSVTVRVELTGFVTAERKLMFPPGSGARADIAMQVGTMNETVSVIAETPRIHPPPAVTDKASAAPDKEEAGQSAPSANVFNLQRRVAGVLPVRVDIPRAGASYQFYRPLVLDEETTVRFRYKAR